jgi:hypothetical protein
LTLVPHRRHAWITRTLNFPGTCWGVVTVMVESLTTLKFTPSTAVPVPNLTPIACLNPDPLIVTVVPPVHGPVFGLTPVTTIGFTVVGVARVGVGEPGVWLIWPRAGEAANHLINGAPNNPAPASRRNSVRRPMA